MTTSKDTGCLLEFHIAARRCGSTYVVVHGRAWRWNSNRARHACAVNIERIIQFISGTVFDGHIHRPIL